MDSRVCQVLTLLVRSCLVNLRGLHASVMMMVVLYGICCWVGWGLAVVGLVFAVDSTEASASFLLVTVAAAMAAAVIVCCRRGVLLSSQQ